MRVTAVVLPGVAVCLAFSGALLAVGGAQEAKRSVKDGVYSEAQAAQGERLYRRVCAKCHLSDLSGADSAGAVVGETPPALRGPAFLEHWQRKSLGDLHTVMTTGMPLDAPGALAPDIYLSILSYLLKMNDFPAGAAPLPAENEKLQLLMFP